MRKLVFLTGIDAFAQVVVQVFAVGDFVAQEMLYPSRNVQAAAILEIKQFQVDLAVTMNGDFYFAHYCNYLVSVVPGAKCAPGWGLESRSKPDYFLGFGFLSHLLLFQIHGQFFNQSRVFLEQFLQEQDLLLGGFVIFFPEMLIGAEDDGGKDQSAPGYYQDDADAVEGWDENGWNGQQADKLSRNQAGSPDFGQGGKTTDNAANIDLPAGSSVGGLITCNLLPIHFPLLLGPVTHGCTAFNKLVVFFSFSTI